MHANLATDRRLKLPPSRRRGFTLVELLVTISIIALMATFVLFALSAVQETARINKTKSLIAKLDAVIMRQYESYRTRRVPIQIPPGLTPNPAAQLRLDALRALIRMELPDRWSDVFDTDNPSYDKYDPSNPVIELFKGDRPAKANQGPTKWMHAGKPVTMRRPALNHAYIEHAFNVPAGPNPILSLQATTQYEGAECLYMIITLGLADDSGGRDLFHDSNVGDADKDGFPEFIDGWGNPIRFLRWAPGFFSDLQPVDIGRFDSNPLPTTFPTKAEIESQAQENPDPFDPRHVYSFNTSGTPTFALLPLIYSAGPDEITDILTTYLVNYPNSTNPEVSYAAEGNNPHIQGETPNERVPVGERFDDDTLALIKRIGMPYDTDLESPKYGHQDHNGKRNYFDNIHNHDLGTR